MMRAGRDYGVEVITSYETKRVGDVIYPSRVLRQSLIRQGLVRPRQPTETPPPPLPTTINKDGVWPRVKA